MTGHDGHGHDGHVRGSRGHGSPGHNGHGYDGPRRCTDDREDRGSGTVIAVGIAGVIASLLVVAVLLAAAVLAVHRARSAADLASIGASRTVLLGGDQRRACREATELARANDAVLVGCSVSGGDVEVQTTVALPKALRSLGHREARATAKAGPR